MRRPVDLYCEEVLAKRFPQAFRLRSVVEAHEPVKQMEYERTLSRARLKDGRFRRQSKGFDAPARKRRWCVELP